MSKQFKVKYTRSSNNPDFKVTTPYIYYSLFYACYFEYNIPPPTFNDTINRFIFYSQYQNNAKKNQKRYLVYNEHTSFGIS